MGDILKAISEDTDEYMELCRRYGEKPRYSLGSPDCYGEHAKELKRRFAADRPVREVMES